MKKLFTFLSIVGLLGAGNAASAQSFTCQHDTVYINTNTSGAFNNNVIVPTGSPNVSVQWRIISSNLPAAWMNTVGICDNFTCYGTADIWPTQTKTSSYPAGEGVFDVTLDLSSFAPDGPYVMKVRLNNSAVTTDTFVQTYIVTRTPGTSSVASVKSSSNVSLYPNPATNSVNLVYDAGADIRNIAVYNIIGKQVSLFRPTDNSSANLNIDNIPSGIYFVRLINSRGDVVSTRKFTKQ